MKRLLIFILAIMLCTIYVSHCKAQQFVYSFEKVNAAYRRQIQGHNDCTSQTNFIFCVACGVLGIESGIARSSTAAAILANEN